VIKLADLEQRLLADPDVLRDHEALATEFAIARERIALRTGPDRRKTENDPQGRPFDSK
jgi:hypothetical protein